MLRAVLVAGLPGSGKSTYCKSTGLRVFDEFAPADEKHLDPTVSFIANSQALCDPENMQRAIAMIEDACPNHKIELIYFSNDPAQCYINVCKRGTKKVSEGFLHHLSSLYHPPSETMPVYKEPEDG